MYSFIASVSMLTGQKCNGIDGQARLYPDTQGLPGLWLASISHRDFFLLFHFFAKFGRLQQQHAKDYQSSQDHNTRQDRQTQREKIT
jgi:hypothetical protein